MPARLIFHFQLAVQRRHEWIAEGGTPTVFDAYE